MSDILNFNVVRALDLDGYPVPGAQAQFFDSGTDTPRAVFADPDGNVPHPSPLVADAEGVFPPVFALGGDAVRAEITDADGAMLTGYPLDPVPRISISASGASQISFNPTGDIPATTVQAAIEKVQANIVAPLAEYGIGVTGNSDLLTSIDAADIPSGFYRYDGTTDGTFPSGVTKANGGVVEVIRKSATAAEMALHPTGDAQHYRRELATTWGAWVKSVDDATVTSRITSMVKSGLNAGGSAPIYACRAWGDLNGVAVTIRAGGNIASFTRQATGRYTVTFATPMPDANYSVSLSCGNNTESDVGWFIQNGVRASKTVNGFKIQTTRRDSDRAFADVSDINVAVFR